MNLFASLLLLSTGALAQGAAAVPSVTGEWNGFATAHHQQVPVRLAIWGAAPNLTAALLNGPESTPATSVALTGDHLVISFNYYARTIDGTVTGGTFTGSFGTAEVRYPVSLTSGKVFHAAVSNVRQGRRFDGDWEIAVHSDKGESAWRLHIDQPQQPSWSTPSRAVIQRVDGDTGSLYGQCEETTCTVSRFSAASPALYRFTLQPDGTMRFTNLLHADLTPPDQQNLVGRRPEDARREKLAAPTDPTQQTTVKDPDVPFAFSFPDLTGKIVSNTDARFDGKVVIVAIGGSWCPNCHDEAPLLVSLYKRFHDQGLEIVNLSFEDSPEQLKNPTRLRTFIARYGITYPVLLAGDTDHLNAAIPQGVNLNSWPTSFFLGRDGKVREVHAGFAGPANPAAHEALVREMTTLVESLLAEPVPAHLAVR
jgi:peroxiredoxin